MNLLHFLLLVFERIEFPIFQQGALRPGNQTAIPKNTISAYLEQLHQSSKVTSLHMPCLRRSTVCDSLLDIQTIMLFATVASANSGRETGAIYLETPAFLLKLFIPRYLLANFCEVLFHLLTQTHIQT
jgi:hypothetical protein